IGVPRDARARADRRLRPLRARPLPREAGQGARGERPLQARELTASGQGGLRVADPRSELAPRSLRPGRARCAWASSALLEALVSVDGALSARQSRAWDGRSRIVGWMRAVVQRVARAKSTPGGEIGAGLVVLLGVADGDGDAEAERLAGKIARLR